MRIPSINRGKIICVIRVICGSFEEASEPQIHADDAEAPAAFDGHPADRRYGLSMASCICVISDRRLECDAASS